MLRPGGVLVGSVPNAFRMQSRLRFLRGRPPEDDPDAPPDVLAGAMRACSPAFDDVELDFVGGRYARLNARLFARDLVFRAVRP